jgi:hypothetical protein
MPTLHLFYAGVDSIKVVLNIHQHPHVSLEDYEYHDMENVVRRSSKT